ncbi:hypothetical protein KUTeg_022672, partial [Tegillarca granosa]
KWPRKSDSDRDATNAVQKIVLVQKRKNVKESCFSKMDPNHWRNYNQPYGHLGHAGGLAPSAANINIPLLAAEQAGINPGLGLGTLQTHPSVRPVTGLTGGGSTYPLHNPVSQFLDAVNPLQSPYSSQTPFKPSAVQQSPFSLDPSIRSSDQSSLYGLHQQNDSVRAHPKPTYVEEAISSKEQSKHWGLSNFVPSQSHSYGNLASDVTSPTDLTSPPPAHSGSSGNRMSNVQRNVISEDLYSTSSGKSAFHSSEYEDSKNNYQLSNTPHQMSKNRSDFSVSGCSIKDLTKSQTQNMYNTYVSAASVITSDSLYQSKVSSDINYDPVSPATPLSDTGQQNDDYRTVLQEFEAGVHSGHNSVSKGQDLNMLQESHHLLKYSGMPRSGSQQSISQQEVKQVHSSNLGSNSSLHNTHSQSPMQPSPLGGSPHMQMAMGSPQMPSSTVVQSTPPVQAIPDSTTKPKRGRGRKKKDNSEKLKQENLSQNLNQSHDMSQMSINNSAAHMINMGNHQYNQHGGHSYSPQKLQPCSPHTSQGYSPQISVQSAPSNSIPSPINRMTGSMGDGVIRPGTNNVNHNTVSGHPNTLKNSPQVHTSISLSDNLSMSNTPLLADSILGNENFGYENIHQPSSFVEQLHSAGVRMGHMEKSGLDDPLGMHSLGLTDTGNIYTDLETYGNQFENPPNSVPHSNMSYGDSPMHQQHGHPTSTIDEVTLSNLMGQTAPKDSGNMIGESHESWNERTNIEQMRPHPPPIEIDEEFQHLTKPPPDKPKPKNSNNFKVLGGKVENPPPKPPVPSKPSDNSRQSSASNSFLGSFLSFIQGKKPETLSSVNNSVVKRPELPKYIPEPRRARLPDPPEKEKTESLSSLNGSSASNAIGFSDDDSDETDNSNSNLNSTLKTVILNLSDSEEKSNKQTGNPPLKIRISVSKTASSKKSSKSKSKSRNRNKSGSSKKSSHAQIIGDEETANWSGGETAETTGEIPEIDLPPSPAPLRRSSRKTTETKKKYVDTDDEEDEFVGEVSPVKAPVMDEELDYDSDKDPAWTPFAAEHVEILPGFKIGDYIMDRKDLNKFESFPIWRIEHGKMIRKFELYTENGQIRHRAICTFSSWMPSMQRDFIPISVRVISCQKDKEVVEVADRDRPKPALDSTLETAYEEDPLADMFNVYMQIFLSQAMEPGFLGAIQESGEDFYLGPLNSIDNLISRKQDEIEAKVKWRDQFRRALRCKPHIRELDRPNLKQACQACEHASQPAIKSVHLFGQSYDHFTLEDHPVSSTEGGSMEFLIGRMAANYVGTYHSLYHYKYNLYKRCVAKIDIVKQENPNLDNADILDKCLNNRTWVLKIFDDLKTMLDKG